jgi:hypothetical protein
MNDPAWRIGYHATDVREGGTEKEGEFTSFGRPCDGNARLGHEATAPEPLEGSVKVFKRDLDHV